MLPALAQRIYLLLTKGEGSLPSLGPEQRADVLSIPEIDRCLADIFAESKPPETPHNLIRAILLLWHDHLDESHAIAQNLANPDGSFVHGIIHRREPDYSNAKYWFHRVGDHPVFHALGAQARAQRLSGTPYSPLVPSDQLWDPIAFIDAIARAPHDDALQKLQAIEIAALLQHVLS